MIRNYVIDNNGTLELKKTNQRPANTVGILPAGEDIAWMQVELVDVNGEMVPTLTVDQPTKDAVLQQRFDDQQAKDAAAAAAQAIKDAKAQKLIDFNKNTVNGLDDIKNELENIVEFLKENFGY